MKHNTGLGLKEPQALILIVSHFSVSRTLTCDARYNSLAPEQLC